MSTSPGTGHEMVFDATSTAQRPTHSLLSDRELQVFHLLVSGKAVNDIAVQLAISNKSVRTHKTRLLEKMSLTGMADLMRSAMQHHLLS